MQKSRFPLSLVSNKISAILAAHINAKNLIFVLLVVSLAGAEFAFAAAPAGRCEEALSGSSLFDVSATPEARSADRSEAFVRRIHLYPQQNPYDFAPSIVLIDGLIKASLKYQSASHSHDPNSILNQIDEIDLFKLIIIASKRKLYKDFRNDINLARQRRYFYESVNELINGLVLRLENMSDTKVSLYADQYVVMIENLISITYDDFNLRNAPGVATQMNRLAKYADQSISNLLSIYHDIRHVPDAEAYRLIAEKIKNIWQQPFRGRKNTELVSDFIRLNPNISRADLFFFISSFRSYLEQGNQYALQSYPNFLRSLILFDPQAALQFAKQLSHPPLVAADYKSKMYAHRQLLFCDLYFSKVLKTEVPWVAQHVQSLTAFAEHHNSHMSIEQKKIFPELARLYSDIIPEYEIPGTIFDVDFYVPREKLIIEIDGPFHYFQTPQGKSLFRMIDRRRDEILEAMGYKVIRLSQQEIRSLRIEKPN